MARIVTEVRQTGTEIVITQGADNAGNISAISSTSMAKKIISIIPNSWYEEMDQQQDGYTDVSYGFLVENFKNAGLDLLLDHDSEGNPISVNYAKVTTALVPYLKELDNRLIKLEGVINNENNG